MPDKLIVSTVRQLFAWFSVKCTITGALVKYASHGNAVPDVTRVYEPNGTISSSNMASKTPTRVLTTTTRGPRFTAKWTSGQN